MAEPPASVPVESRAFASAAQQQVWLREQIRPALSASNLPFAFWLEGSIDHPTLTLALNDVVARREGLRTRFDITGGQLVRIVMPQLVLPMPVVDLRLLPMHLREINGFQLAREEAARPFDLRRMPLVRAQLFVLNDYTRLLTLVAHPIVFADGLPPPLLPEITAAYSARRALPLSWSGRSISLTSTTFTSRLNSAHPFPTVQRKLL